MTKEAPFTIKQLLEAGVHFGHKTMRWNPKMAPYIYDVYNNIHIINLKKTAPLLAKSLEIVEEIAQKNGKVLFVGTKKQASETIAEEAQRCGQSYINNRWLGGMLTNWSTISKSLKKLKKIEDELANETSVLNKKEKLLLDRQRVKLEKNLGGIRHMGNYPDLVFVIDTKRENLAIKEAKALQIPVMAIADTNSDPDEVDYLIPGNDDSIKAIRLYCRLVSDAILEGIRKGMEGAGVAYNEEKTKGKGEKLSTKKSKNFAGNRKEEKTELVKVEETQVPAVVEEAEVVAVVEEPKTLALKKEVKSSTKVKVASGKKLAEGSTAKKEAVEKEGKKVEKKAESKKASVEKTSTTAKKPAVKKKTGTKGAKK